ncbi:phosphotransferase [Dactylosporangium sp. NPDC049525]|uniref:phosphotransferase n=1 Tax=Dactylosporangium sp. NPDC049525 TaxID=3154730 RepID=UPI003415DEA5
MRLDVPACAAALGLTYDGPCPGGEVGAGYVLLPDGRRAVLSSGRRESAALVDLARAAGVPAPRYELVTEVAGATVVVQELLPGHPPAAVDRAVVDGMLAVSARCTGLLRDSGLPQRELYLHRDGPGFCLHGSLEGHSARTAALLATVRAVPLDELPGDDLVHLDYHPHNILVTTEEATGEAAEDTTDGTTDGTGGRVITGVVDWDGAGRGTRAFDLVTLLFWLSRHAPHLAPPVRAAAAALAPPEVLVACWAHMALRQVDWSIRHHTAEEVDAWLTVAEQSPF